MHSHYILQLRDQTIAKFLGASKYRFAIPTTMAYIAKKFDLIIIDENC